MAGLTAAGPAEAAACADEVPLLCQGCAACCRAFRVSFYHGETRVPEAMTLRISPFLVCMKGTERGNGPCIALRDGLCTIYGNRPSTCRDFPVLVDGRWNPGCVEVRRKLGIV